MACPGQPAGSAASVRSSDVRLGEGGGGAPPMALRLPLECQGGKFHPAHCNAVASLGLRRFPDRDGVQRLGKAARGEFVVLGCPEMALRADDLRIDQAGHRPARAPRHQAWLGCACDELASAVRAVFSVLRRSLRTCVCSSELIARNALSFVRAEIPSSNVSFRPVRATQAGLSARRAIRRCRQEVVCTSRAGTDAVQALVDGAP
jgi:hypothetical protein